PTSTLTLFPYTTLFRSYVAGEAAVVRLGAAARRAGSRGRACHLRSRSGDERLRQFPGSLPRPRARPARRADVGSRARRAAGIARSEEHTSELQSLAYLV